MAGTVEKKILRFGGRLRTDLGAGNLGGWAGVPGDPELGGAAIISNLVAATSNTLDQVGIELQTPGRHHAAGPIRAIAIANDSPLESCDLYFGSGGQVAKFRVSPGAPFIGDIGEDNFIRIAPAREMPIILGVQPNVSMSNLDFKRQVHAWEMPLSSINGVDALPVPSPLIPLKICVYRGDAQINAIWHRASYHASLLWELTAGGPGVGVAPSLIVCVDGRRRFRVIAGQTDLVAGAPSVQVYGLEAWKTSNSTWAFAQGDRDRVSFDELLPPTAMVANLADSPVIFDYIGNPYFAVVVNITGPAAARGYAQVHAWDE